MTKQSIINMESMQCRSYEEEKAYYKELAEVEQAIKAVNAVKKPVKELKVINNRFNPQTNYKLTYR